MDQETAAKLGQIDELLGDSPALGPEAAADVLHLIGSNEGLDALLAEETDRDQSDAEHAWLRAREIRTVLTGAGDEDFGALQTPLAIALGKRILERRRARDAQTTQAVLNGSPRQPGVEAYLDYLDSRIAGLQVELEQTRRDIAELTERREGIEAQIGAIGRLRTTIEGGETPDLDDEGSLADSEAEEALQAFEARTSQSVDRSEPAELLAAMIQQGTTLVGELSRLDPSLAALEVQQRVQVHQMDNLQAEVNRVREAENDPNVLSDVPDEIADILADDPNAPEFIRNRAASAPSFESSFDDDEPISSSPTMSGPGLTPAP